MIFDEASQLYSVSGHGRPDCLVYDYNLVCVAIQPTKRKAPKVGAKYGQNSNIFYGQGTRLVTKKYEEGLRAPTFLA